MASQDGQLGGHGHFATGDYASVTGIGNTRHHLFDRILGGSKYTAFDQSTWGGSK
jgi:hypothetical protein